MIDPNADTYEAACRALALANNVAKVNDILAIAAAMEARARQANDRSLELDAIELRFYAEGRLHQITVSTTTEIALVTDAKVSETRSVAAQKIATCKDKGPALPTVATSDEYAGTYEVASRALRTARNVSEVKGILSMAAMMEAYARQANNRVLELDAIELGFHAECRLDQMTADHNDPSARSAA